MDWAEISWYLHQVRILVKLRLVCRFLFLHNSHLHFQKIMLCVFTYSSIMNTLLSPVHEPQLQTLSTLPKLTNNRRQGTPRQPFLYFKQIFSHSSTFIVVKYTLCYQDGYSVTIRARCGVFRVWLINNESEMMIVSFLPFCARRSAPPPCCPDLGTKLQNTPRIQTNGDIITRGAGLYLWLSCCVVNFTRCSVRCDVLSEVLRPCSCHPCTGMLYGCSSWFAVCGSSRRSCWKEDFDVLERYMYNLVKKCLIYLKISCYLWKWCVCVWISQFGGFNFRDVSFCCILSLFIELRSSLLNILWIDTVNIHLI